MSAAQKVQQHPMYIQAQGKASYYHSQLDKEVSCHPLLSSERTDDWRTRPPHPQLTKYPFLNSLEQRSGVPKTYAVIGGASLLVLLHLINPLAAFISNLVGWALPAYLSFKAIESPSPQDDIQWLTYWVVFGFFNFLESFALRVVLYYLPWYFAFKTVFILWLQLPAFRVSFRARVPRVFLVSLPRVDRSLTCLFVQGAQTTYLTVLKPVLANASGRMQPVAASTTDTANAALHHE
jgi:receptor expression-enhancing protein 5/6